jgi:hypothetical protein
LAFGKKRVPDSISNNYFIALRPLTARYQTLKPFHAAAVPLFRLGMLHPIFEENTEVLARSATVPLIFDPEGLPLTDITVVGYQNVFDGKRRTRNSRPHNAHRKRRSS